jgi:hypothetical protein
MSCAEPGGIRGCQDEPLGTRFDLCLGCKQFISTLLSITYPLLQRAEIDECSFALRNSFSPVKCIDLQIFRQTVGYILVEVLGGQEAGEHCTGANEIG